MHEFTERGFVLNYVVDNTESEADLAQMLTYVPEVFRAAGLLVIPQLMALEIMERIEGRPKDVPAIPSTIDEGQHLAEEFVTQCHEDRRSYVYLNLQLAEDNSRLSLDVALSNTDTPGTLVVPQSASGRRHHGGSLRATRGDDADRMIPTAPGASGQPAGFSSATTHPAYADRLKTCDPHLGRITHWPFS